MNSQQARDRVCETFQKSFDKVRFHQFAKELLNGFNEDKAAPMQVPEAYVAHIRSCARLGTYEAPDGELADVLIVHTTEPWKLERTRTALRDFVAHKLKRGDSYKEAGLVAFVAPDARSWRFSFVRMEYESKRNPTTGKIAVEERLTPARRFSYIVGEDENCHTAQSRFLDLLEDTDNKPTLEEIEKAFSVEAVTKEFFEQYKTLFLDLKEELDAIAKRDKTIREEFAEKKVSTADFAKKLMGQIVFLYFLQKKGWLGVAKGGDWGDGTHKFLRQLYDKKFGSYENFFNDILEPLFYDTLATDRGHDAWCSIFKCRIPFLNGGLFEPVAGYDWKKTNITIPDSLFSNSTLTKAGDQGTGILDVFDRYNFTVNEAEPLEKEVAIDPEMLGKVFENLLEVKERKSKGSFYTPREIVHYMCQESLINYLDTAINSEICSSGREFAQTSSPQDQSRLTSAATNELIPRADLETFIHSGDQISHYEAVDTHYAGREMPRKIKEHAKLLDEKLADITVCDPAIGSGAFPVGMMQEIVRARSALTPYFNDVKDRTAYHFKRHAIQNCIYGVDIDPGAVEIAKLRLWLSLVVDEEDVKQIKPLPNLDYKIVSGNSLLGVEKNLFNQELFKRLEELKPKYFDATDRKQKENFKREIDDLIHELTNGKEAFDFEIYFSEIFHRKKGFDVMIMNPPYGANFSKNEKSIFSLQFKYQDYQLDSYLLFFERAFPLCSVFGYIALIIPNTWLQNLLSKKLRRHIFLSKTVDEVIHFRTSIFEAVVDNEVVLLKNCEPAESHNIRISIFGESGSKRSHFTPQRRWQLADGEPVNVLEKPEISSLVDKLRRLKSFGDFYVITQGAKPFQVGKGVPPQTREIVDTKPFVADTKKNKTFVPLLRGSLINRYQILWQNNYWISFGDWLAEPRYSGNFDAPEKIVIRQTGDSLIAALDTRQFIARDNLYTIVVHGKEYGIRFALGLLNSRFLTWFYRNVLNPEEGEALAQVKRGHLVKLPIPAATRAEQKPVEKLVERILAAKAKSAAADVSKMEREIDELVYALYALTPAEIKIVEGTK